jgi:ureidoacrylate peracid hydrolase
MYRADVPQEYLSEMRKIRGGRHAFENITPAQTALVVIDMQNYYLQDADKKPHEVTPGIVENINKLAKSLRDAGGTVIWIETTFTAEGRAAYSLLFENIIAPEIGHAIRANVMEGTEGHALWSELDIKDQDQIIVKDRFSAFIPGSSNIEAFLRDKGIDTIVLTGVETDVCCESSGRDAMMMGFKAIMIDDACAATSLEGHLSALRTFARVFGDVRYTDDMIETFETS